MLVNAGPVGRAPVRRGTNGVHRVECRPYAARTRSEYLVLQRDENSVILALITGPHVTKESDSSLSGVIATAPNRLSDR